MTIQKTHVLEATDEKSIKRVVMDENIHYLHVMFPKGEGYPKLLQLQCVHDGCSR